MESNDKIRFFHEVDAFGPDGELQVDPAVSLNKVINTRILSDI